MIHEAFYRNFRAIRNVTVPLRQLTVIVGPNASGKTTILRGLQYLLERVRPGQSDAYFSGERHPLLLSTRGTDGKTSVGVKSDSGTVSFEYQVPSGLSMESLHQAPPASPNWNFSVKCMPGRKSDWVELNQAPDFVRSLPEARLLKLEPARLASPSTPGLTTEIQESGEGLASALWLLNARDHDTLKRIEQQLCTIIPSIRRIRFERVPTSVLQGMASQPALGGMGGGFFGGGSQIGESLSFDTVAAKEVPVSCMSDGTLLVLGLLTVLHTTRSKLILLDDLEHGLHPKAQREFVPLIRELLKSTPGLQIVATTHSPYLVDVLEPEEVRITTVTDRGDVQCSTLDRHPDFARWKDEMSPGEFWSAVGESWVAEQAAAKQ